MLVLLPGLRQCSICCGWPFPCVCCCPGCCTPCGYSCCVPEGKGVSQAFEKLLLGSGPPHWMEYKSPGKSQQAPTPAAMLERELS